MDNDNKNTDIPRILRLYLKQRLDFDMWARERAPHQPRFPAVSPVGSVLEEDLGWVERQLAAAKSELVERRYDHQRPLIDELMETHSVPPAYRRFRSLHVFVRAGAMMRLLRYRTQQMRRSDELIVRITPYQSTTSRTLRRVTRAMT